MKAEKLKGKGHFQPMPIEHGLYLLKTAPLPAYGLIHYRQFVPNKLLG